MKSELRLTRGMHKAKEYTLAIHDHKIII